MVVADECGVEQWIAGPGIRFEVVSRLAHGGWPGDVLAMHEMVCWSTVA